jgi:peroxin-5
LHFSLREFEVAEECFRECLKLNPHSHALWNKLAATYANRMNLDKALQGYKIALSLYPQYTRAQVNIALALDNHNHYQRVLLLIYLVVCFIFY